MFKDKKSGNWLYRHELPNGKWFVRSLRTGDRTKAEHAWTKVDAEYNAMAAGQRSTKRYEDSKDARREKFWQAAARFIIWMKASHGGRLPRPAHIEVPTAMRLTSHPFVYVRSAFLQWAKEHDRDAVTVFQMGDMREEPLFHAGIIAAYFTISELERLQPPAPVVVSAIPSGQHTLEQVFEDWVKKTSPAEASKADVKRAMLIFGKSNPEADPESPRTVEQITREHVERMRDMLSKMNYVIQTRNKRIAGISILLGHAMREFWIEANYTRGMKFDAPDPQSVVRLKIKEWVRRTR